jgi:hypothetical protein
MAGNPLQKLVPHIKKNAVLLYIIAGPLLFLMGARKDSKTYKSVYGENNFQRAYHLERLREHIDQAETNRNSAEALQKH